MKAIKINPKKMEFKVLDDKYVVKMKPFLTRKMFREFAGDGQEINPETGEAVIKMSKDKLESFDRVVGMMIESIEPKVEDVSDFIDNLPTDDFAKLQEYVTSKMGGDKKK